jgi:serine protease Do
MSRREKRLRSGLIAIVFAAIAILSLPAVVSRLSYAVEVGQAEAAREQLQSIHDLSTGFKLVAKSVRPSVVNVSVTKATSAGPRGPAFEQPFFREFREFFSQRQPERFRRDAPHERVTGLGSGVIIRDEGYVVTNYHVVAGASEVDVILSDGTKAKAKVIGHDDKTDIAVLKIEASGLVAATLGTSSDVEVGEWVLAAGSPFGLTETVTSGIVSAIGRSDVGVTEYEDFIQTDAAINPGNSGGPLVNLRGEVIGINTAIATRTGTYAGVGFAIPIDLVRNVVQQIIDSGKVVRGWLGVGIQDMDEDLAKSFGHDSKGGVLVTQIWKDNPAGKAGVQPEDILVAFGDTELKDSNHLRHLVASTAPGTEVTLRLVRDGQPKALTVEIGEREATAGSPKSSPETHLGMTAVPLTPELARRLDHDGDAGVLVTEVEPGGLAHRAGIRAMDVILSADRQPIASLGDLREALGEENLARGVRVQIARDGYRRFLFLKK